MSYFDTPFPSQTELKRLVRHALSDNAAFKNPEIVDRKQNPTASTYPIEVVTVRGANGCETSLFIKYEPVHRQKLGFGFIEHERFVYERILPGAGLSHCRYLGTAETNDSTCLMLGYLNGAMHVSKSPDSCRALLSAATWIANFHGRSSPHVSTCDRVFPRKAYQYYRDAIAVSAKRLRHDERPHPWVVEMCRVAHDLTDWLCENHGTLVHGEYYPANILEKDGRIYPVDWELAATGPGVLDLAALVMGWPPHVQRACMDRYRAVRQEDKDSESFMRGFKAAQLLLQFAWIGSPKYGPFDDSPPWRDEVIQSVKQYYRAAAEAWGIS